MFQDLHRGRQGAGAQHHRQVFGFLIGEAAGDRGFSAADLVLDDRGGIDHSIQHNGQSLLDVFTRYPLEHPRPLGIEIEGHVGGVVLAVDADFGVGDGGAGQERSVLEDNLVFPRAGLAGVGLAHGVELGPHRQLAFLCGLGTDLFRHHFEFKQSGLSDQRDGTLRVLNARQLNQDPIFSLQPNVRLGHPELVDSIADGFERLAFRHLANPLCFRILENEVHGNALGQHFGTGNLEEGEDLFHDLRKLSLVFRAGQLGYYLRTPGVLHLDEGHLLGAQGLLEIIGKAFHMIVDRFVSLHFQHEVHAALEIETEVNPFLWQKPLPPRWQRGTQSGRQVDHRPNEDHHD